MAKAEGKELGESRRRRDGGRRTFRLGRRARGLCVWMQLGRRMRGLGGHGWWIFTFYLELNSPSFFRLREVIYITSETPN